MKVCTFYFLQTGTAGILNIMCFIGCMYGKKLFIPEEDLSQGIPVTLFFQVGIKKEVTRHTQLWDKCSL